MAGLLLASLIASLLVGAYLLGQANQGLELARLEAIESAELIQEQQQKIESMTFDLATLRLEKVSLSLRLQICRRSWFSSKIALLGWRTKRFIIEI
jgi:hypothetical protein